MCSTEEMNPQHREIIHSNVQIHLKHAEDIEEYLLVSNHECHSVYIIYTHDGIILLILIS